MKKRNLFLTLGLALTLGAGVAGGLSLNRGEAKEAGAYTVGSTFYFEANNTWTGATDDSSTFLWAHFYKNGGAGTYDVKLANLSGNIFKGTWPDTSSLDRIMFTRGDSSEPKWWDETYAYSFDFILSGNNYLKQRNDGWDAKDVDGYMEYRPELAAGKAYLRGSWSGGWGTFDHEMTLKSENVYEIENVLLTSGSQIKAITIGDDKFVDWHDASACTGNSGATFVAPNITINTTGNYTVTVNTSTKAYNVDVYEDVDLTAAESFADDFKTSMGKYCPITGSDAAKGNEKLATEWSSFATRFNNDLSDGARSYLKTLEDGGKIEEFRERYASIMGDYKALLSTYNFLNIDLGSALVVAETPKSNSAVIAVVTISAISLVAAGSFFVIRRRKEQE